MVIKAKISVSFHSIYKLGIKDRPTEGIVSFMNSKCPPQVKISEDLCTQNALEAIW